MEVVFSESAAGCLSVAAHKRKFTDAVSSAIIVGAAGESQSQNQEEIQKMVMESQNKERINWENMIPLEIERKDILCFPVALSIGEITEQEIGKQRESAITNLMSVYPEMGNTVNMHALSFRWDQLKQENAPLRAVVNRQLVSVSEDFYDSFIFRELNSQEDEFMEAYLIGKVLGNYSLGISDSFLALRIEKFIKDGILQPITKAKSEDPSYHRMLRKVGK